MEYRRMTSSCCQYPAFFFCRRQWALYIEQAVEGERAYHSRRTAPKKPMTHIWQRSGGDVMISRALPVYSGVWVSAGNAIL